MDQVTSHTVTAFEEYGIYKQEHYIHAYEDPDTDCDYVFRGEGMRSLEAFYMLNLCGGIYDRREDRNNNIRLSGNLKDKIDIVSHPCNYNKDGMIV
jgi:hypothetical protein